ncbi:MAG: M1 family aminopeptidase [Vicinamibacterales bacterium]
MTHHHVRGTRRGTRHAWAPLALVLGALLLPATTGGRAAPAQAPQDAEATARTPPLYTALREAPFEVAGRIRDGALRIDRFDLTFEEGDLYLRTPVAGRRTAAVFIGRGRVRAYPPDGVEHQQMRKLLDDDRLDEAFDRLVLWFSGDVGDRLAALAVPPGADERTTRAADVLDERRRALLETRFVNPESRLLADVIPGGDSVPGFVLAEVRGGRHGWFSIEVEPRDEEEVRVARVDARRGFTNVWLGTHALADFGPEVRERAFAGFPRDPEREGPIDPDGRTDRAWTFRDFGLPARPLAPEREQWAPVLDLPRTDVDLTLNGSGEATARAHLLLATTQPLATVRLVLSPYLRVTDVRWIAEVPDTVLDVRGAPLGGDERSGEAAGPTGASGAGRAEPVPTGVAVPWVQETRNRRIGDDLYERHVTVVLPETLPAGARGILAVSYEGKLVERLTSTQDFLLKDTAAWFPGHPDARRTRLRLTFRVPNQFRIASGGTLVDDREDGDTRVLVWVNDQPVRASMAFQYGRFEVTQVTDPGIPPIAIYANRNHLGFAPGNRQRTLDDLAGSLRTYGEYFGPYPFPSLLATETPGYNGQAFPGLALLSFQAFGAMNTNEAALFRAHEVAHQWWGALVDWQSYRDQWISEGFAHYAAALYTLMGRGEASEFDDMLDAWHLDILGQVNVGRGAGLRSYGFTPAAMRLSEGHESGPVVAGYRLITSETPFDYQLVAYEKGAFILHMLRSLLLDPETGDDERFRALMRRTVETHAASPITTEGFERLVSDAFGEPMAWFFDQWVYGVDVPTYRPALRLVPTPEATQPFALRGRIRQEDVPPTFRMPLPIAVRFADGTERRVRVLMEGRDVAVDIPLPATPVSFDVNPRHAVLADVR